MALLSTMANSDGATSIGATSRRCKRSVPLRGAAKFGATSIGDTSRRCKDRCCVEARRKVRCYCDRCNFEVLQRSVPLRGTVKFGATSIGATSRRCKDRCRLEALQGSVPLRGNASLVPLRGPAKISVPLRGASRSVPPRRIAKSAVLPRGTGRCESSVLFRGTAKIGAAARRVKIGAASDRCRFEALRE